MFELIRKFSLFMLLFVVGMGTYLTMQRTTDWREPLWVQIYPINGDGLDSTQAYIENLNEESFAGVEQFMRDEANRYKVAIEEPVKIYMGQQINEQPPEPPYESGPLGIAYWSLKLRWWASSVTSDQPGPRPDIRLFLIYFDPNVSRTVAHSLGLQKGLIGIVNAFAADAQSKTNNFVVAHEMLHTLGATDKYGGSMNLPIYPNGYADPSRHPRYPQANAEVMGGRIPLSETSATMPASLRQTVVGTTTAEEIRWIK